MSRRTDEIPMAKSWPLFKWLWKGYLSPYKWPVSVAFIMMSIQGVLLAVLAKTLEPMFDKVFVEGSTSAMKWVALAILGIFVGRAVTGVVQKMIMAGLAPDPAPRCAGICWPMCCNWTANFTTITRPGT